MSSKPKSRTWIVLHRSNNTIVGRYKVGARNYREAEELVKGIVGKHTKVKVYYEVTNESLPHGTIIKEC